MCAGAKAASGNVFVFLNNDTEIRSPDWLTVLAALARHPRLGAVGPRLLYADGTVQHEGVVIGMGQLVLCLGDRRYAVFEVEA